MKCQSPLLAHIVWIGTCALLFGPLVRAQEDIDSMAPEPDALATIDEGERFSPTTRPTVPEPQHPPLSNEKNVDTGKPPHQWQRATNDWLGLRPRLDDLGITIQGDLAWDVSWRLHGSTAPGGATASRTLANVNITLDTQRLLGWQGGTFFINYQNKSGRDGSELYPTLQGISNIDGPNRSQISELWYEQSLWDGKVRLKAGKIDANSEFALPENGQEFLNWSMAQSPTILGIPTYPDPAMGMNLIVSPVQGLELALGVYDGALQEGVSTGNRGPSTLFGAPADLFFISEARLRWGAGALPGLLALGLWHHTGTFARFDGGSESGTGGLYVVFDQTLWRQNPGEAEDGRGVGFFAQYGYANPAVSPVAQHFGAGLAWTGPFPGRDEDVLGLAGSFVDYADQPGAAGVGGSGELAIELFYKAQLLKWLSLKSDLQYFHTFGSNATGENDGLMLTMRLLAEF